MIRCWRDALIVALCIAGLGAWPAPAQEPRDLSFGQRTIALARQSRSSEGKFEKYRENARWDLGGVTFLALHVVGSNNGLGRAPEGDAEFAERNGADLAWLREGFAHAKAANSRAVMILQQANIYPEFPPFPGDP